MKYTKTKVVRSFNEILENAKKYDSFQTWKRAERRTFTSARNQGFLPEVTKHMTGTEKYQSSATNEELVERGSNYASSTAWKDANQPEFRVARWRGLLRKCLFGAKSV